MKILIVEDDQDIARAMQIVLVKLGNIVFKSSTLKNAIHLYKTHSIDIIILDLSVLDSRGLETAYTIKKYLTTETVLIVYTARQELLEESLELGVDEFLLKGDFTPLDIPGVIEQAIMNKRLSKAVERNDRMLNGEEITQPGTVRDAGNVGDKLLEVAEEIRLASTVLIGDG